jgi:hypothetical protein
LGGQANHVVNRTLVLAGLLVVVLPAAGATSAAATKVRAISLELVGQVTNTPPAVTPQVSTQFGYLSYVDGLRAFKGDPENETTALFTFYVQATTQRVIVDGPLRVITRVGSFAVYRDPGTNARFSNPETFRDGTKLLVANFRQQVVVDTVSETFTTLNRNTVTATKPFPAGARKVQLATIGARFNTVLNGHLNMPGPPSGYFAGYTLTGVRR